MLHFMKSTIMFLFYVQCDEWSDNIIVIFFANFIPNFLSFLLKYSVLYFKIISLFFVILKTLFFVSFVPIFFQYLLAFFVSFDFFWDGYLLFSVYATIFCFFPYYVYKFYFLKLKVNKFYVAFLKIPIFLIIFLNFSCENALSLVTFLISTDVFKSWKPFK